MVAKRVIVARPIHRRPVTDHGSTSTNTTASHASAREREVHPPLGGARRVSMGVSARADAHVRDPEDLLKGLDSTAKKELLDRLLLEQQLNPDRGQDRDKDMWAAAVYRELSRVGGGADGGLMPQGVIRKAVAVGTSWQHVEAFMKNSRLAEMTVTEKQAVYYLLAQLLVDHARYVARNSGAPLGVKLVTQCTGNLAGVFENAFPGYLEAGLARVVARARLE